MVNKIAFVNIWEFWNSHTVLSNTCILISILSTYFIFLTWESVFKIHAISPGKEHKELCYDFVINFITSIYVILDPSIIQMA